MSSEDRRFGRQPNHVQDEVDGDDEFGDFEGFEGAGLDSIPAAAGPSPWATFPDLLPVQTSPAAATNEETNSSQITRSVESHNHEPWLNVASSSCQRSAVELLPNVAHDGAHSHFTQPRTANPPDVSLSAYQPTYNSTVSEHAGASGISHTHGVENSLPEMGKQLTSLQRQVDTLMQQKHQLQQQLDQLNRDKQQLQHQLSMSHADNTHLRSQVTDLQQQLANSSSNSNSGDSREDVSSILQQIQDSLMHINDTQAKESNSLRETANELKSQVEEKTLAVEKQLSELRDRLDNQTLNPTQDCEQLTSAVTTVVQDCFRQNLEGLSHTVGSTLADVVRNHSSSNQDGVVQHFRVELQRHMDQTRRLLEHERQQNFLSLAQALQAALKQFSATIEPTVNDHIDSSEDGKS